MALPRINAPIFSLEIPSTKTKISYRPFTVQEEKLLLIGQEAGDIDHIATSVKQVIQNCILDEDVDVNKLATFDLEYLFLNLRARSVNNVISLSVKDPKDENLMHEAEINIDEVQVKFSDDHVNKIQLTDDLGVIMRYPDYSTLMKYSSDAEMDNIFGIITACIDSVYDKDEVYDFVNEAQGEQQAFLDSLPVECLGKLRTFFDTMPRLAHTLNVTRPDGSTFTLELNGLNDFFTLA